MYPPNYKKDCPVLIKKQLAQFKPRSAERLAVYGLPPNPEMPETPKKYHSR